MIDDRTIGQHQHNDIRLRCGGSCRVSPVKLGLTRKLISNRHRTIMTDDSKTRFEQVERHRRTHLTQTNKRYRR